MPSRTLQPYRPGRWEKRPGGYIGLQQAGQTIAPSWVLTHACLQRSLQTLVAREPAFADWPELLWQAPTTTGYPRQHFAQRLRHPLLGVTLDLEALNVGALWAELPTPVVRLLPSLWFGESHGTAPFTQMLEAPICWAEPTALEKAIKHLWAELISARSLAYWEHWLTSGDRTTYPEDIGVAIIVQAVEPTTLAGTMTLQPDGHVTFQMIQGLPQGLPEAYPDYYTGALPDNPPLGWQQGYQEQSYQPADTDLSAEGLELCLTVAATPNTAMEVLSGEAETILIETARRLLAQFPEQTMRLEWLLPMARSTQIQVTQALQWPLQPIDRGHSPSPSGALRSLTGRAASPGQITGAALVLKPGMPLPTSAHQQILVATEVLPDWLPLLKTAAAIVSERGGLTCHAAILARELQLPAVVGVTHATTYLQTGDTLRLDGDRGVIEMLTTPVPTPPSSLPRPPAIASPMVQCATEIWLNLSQPDLAEVMASLPVAGIGLLRSEWLMQSVLDRRHPYDWLQYGQSDILRERLVTQLRPIVKAFAPRPVRYRSLDICSNAFTQLQGAPPAEANPTLGVRGTFSYQQQPTFFQLELTVLRQLQLEGYTNLHLVLPFVRTVEEAVFCRRLVHITGLDQTPSFELWMMAEVPSALFLLADYAAAGIQGIAIGTNDLTQLLFGIDRDQALFADYFDERHPAVQAAIAQLIQHARTLNLPCTICGVAPAHHPDLIATFVQQGVTGISVDAAAVDATVRAVQAAEALQHS